MRSTMHISNSSAVLYQFCVGATGQHFWAIDGHASMASWGITGAE